VTGVPASALPTEIPIEAALPRTVNAQQVITVNLPGGPVTVMIRKLRDFPN
jgi:hypothetical protein